MTPPINLDELEAKARAATEGPYRVQPYERFPIVQDCYAVTNDRTMFIAECGRLREQAEYFAAAHPDVVLALCARVRELESEIAQLKMDLNEARTDPSEHLRALLAKEGA